MGILNTYPDDSATTDDDKLATVDASGAVKQTAATTLADYMLSSATVASHMEEGSVTSEKLGLTIGASVTLETSQSLADANLTIVKFDTVAFDTHSAYSTATGKYTVPVAGYYRVHSHYMLNNPGRGNVQGQLMHNTDLIAQDKQIPSADGDEASVNLHRTVLCAVGDTIYTQVLVQNATRQVFGGAGFSYIEIEYAGASS